MIRKIVAVLIGIVAAFLLGVASTSNFWPFSGFTGMLSRNIIPGLIGGIITGYLATRKGWLLGILVGGIDEVFGLLVIVNMADSAGLKMTDYFSVGWWVFQLTPLLFGGLGGYLGEILFKRVKERNKRNKG